jgi:NTP pyrophosphatase (non-canonical NTP hydrolase)
MKMGNLTQDEFAYMVQSKLKPDTPEMQLIHATMGLAGEVGEFVDCIKKHVIYGQPLDLKNAIEELGDIEFYLEAARTIMCLNRDRILLDNITKLNKRYKDSFTAEESVSRADKYLPLVD